MTLAISVFSDVICPWCHVGKRRLERALAEMSLAETTTIAWLPFELNPDMPEDGMPRADYRARKFGQTRARDLDAEMTQRGLDEGIAFAFDRIDRTPSTRRAHRLLAWAARRGSNHALKGALLKAYFEDAQDIGRADILTDIASRHGIAPEDAAAALADPDIDREVDGLEREAARMGVSGVPFFIVDRSWVISGAQPTEAWIQALRERIGRPGEVAAG